MLSFPVLHTCSGEANPTSSTGICGPMTQRLISALLEENIVTSIQETMESEGQGMQLYDVRLFPF